jgi:signal transduction histidine kinase
MGDERSGETNPGIAPGLDGARRAAALAGALQRARLLASGIAGPVTDRQRSLLTELVRDLELLGDAEGSARRIEVETFALDGAVCDVVGRLRFAAHRKRLTVSFFHGREPSLCVADPSVVRTLLADALGAAVALAPSGGKVFVELARSADRLVCDVSAPGWEPRLPPVPPAGSGAALSVLRGTGGARLVLSVPAAS